MILTGTHITWFLPKPWRWTDPTGHVWHDTGAERNGEGAFASGLPFDTLGIAVHEPTLGGWWKVAFPKLGITITVRQVDIGPNKPVIDLSATLAYAMFKTEAAFPDHSPWEATYLGRVLPAGETEGVVRIKAPTEE